MIKKILFLIAVLILMAVIFYYFHARESINDIAQAKILGDISLLEKSIELYHEDFNRYPESLNDLKGKYLVNVPIHPSGLNYIYERFDKNYRLDEPDIEN